MKKMRFMDNITTPARWKSEALDKALEEKPKLKRWQTAGAAAAAAAIMVSLVLMPMLFVRNPTPMSSPDSDPPELMSSSENKSAVYEEDTPLNIVDKMHKKFDYIERVTVLDFEYLENIDGGVIRLVAVRETALTSNKLLCTDIISGYEDLTEDGPHKLEFGDSLLLGFNGIDDGGYTGDYLVNSSREMELSVGWTINGTEYSARQPKGTLYCSGYAYVGTTYNSTFSHVFDVARIVTGISDKQYLSAGNLYYDYNEETAKLVRSHYTHIGPILPIVYSKINNSKRFFVSDKGTIIFDDRYTVDGAVSQLAVMIISEQTAEGRHKDIEKTEIEWDKESGECKLHIDGRTCNVIVDSYTDIEVLDMKFFNPKDMGSAYLVMNFIDAEHTGNVRRDVTVTLDFEDADTQEEPVTIHRNAEISNVITDGDELDATIVPLDIVTINYENRSYADGSTEDLLNHFYTFEITPKALTGTANLSQVLGDSWLSDDTLILSLGYINADLIIKNESGHKIVPVTTEYISDVSGAFKVGIIVVMEEGEVGDDINEVFSFTEETENGAKTSTVQFKGRYTSE